MKNKTAKTDSLGKKTIQIISTRTLQCELMAHYMTTAAGVSCKIASDPAAITVNPKEADHGTLVLLDCPDRDPVKYFMALAVSGKRVLSNCPWPCSTSGRGSASRSGPFPGASGDSSTRRTPWSR